MLISKLFSASWSASGTFLILLLLADLVFICVHIVLSFGILPTTIETSPKLFLTRDRSYSEMFEYIKLFWLSALLAMLCVAVRTPLYGGLALFSAYLLLDNATRIHERGGAWLRDNLGIQPAFGLRPEDFGELSISLSAALVLLPLNGLLYLRSNLYAKRACRDLALLLGLLVFFGIAVDMMGIILHYDWLHIVEDGGELVSISLLLGYAFRLQESRGVVQQTIIQKFLHRSHTPVNET